MDQEKLTWICECYYAGHPDIGTKWMFTAYVCGDDLEEADDNCATDVCSPAPYAIDDRINPDSAIACSTNPGSMNCSSWAPENEITYYSSFDYYGMDWSFAAGLLADPEPLWACDDAVLQPLTSGGGFEVTNANSGELLYELGLRNGDKLLSLNGYDLTNYYDAGVAFAELQGETNFTLEILRGTNTIELDYVLFVTG